MKAILNRLYENEKQTLGRLYLYDGIHEVFTCCTLELPDKGNQNSISRICGGAYQVKRRYSHKHGWHYHIQDVEGRSLILFHKGNYYTQIEGCVLVGTDFRDINNDDEADVVNSGVAMETFLSIAGEGFELVINEI